MEQLNNFAEKIDGLTLRERTIVFVGIIAVIYILWDSVFMSPLSMHQKKIIAEINKKNAERVVLITHIQEIIKQDKEDPDAVSLARLKELRSKLIDVQAALETTTDNLVSPKEMPKVLETVLHKTGGLNLLGLRSLGVKPVDSDEEIDMEANKTVEISKDESGIDKKLTAGNIDNAYRHGLRIEITGNYLTALSYLKSLEELEWDFFWDNFELTVDEYPNANIAIEIFTLSLNQEWIGV